MSAGTSTCPLAICNTTPLPAEIVEPGSGETFNTVPCSRSDGTACVDEITKPTAASELRASIRDKPTKSVGTMASPGPSEIVRMTLEPLVARVVASGNWLATRSLGILESWAR